MEPDSRSFENGSEPCVSHLLLISGLPDHISLLCLARVPRKYHTVLRCVSRRWRDLVQGDELWLCRKKHQLDETWIYALCGDRIHDQVCCYVLDPNSMREGWKLIHDLPARSLKRKGMAFEGLGKKLYLLGGCGWSTDATHEVYCYDASINTWSEASPLPTARCYFASDVVNGKIYAIGGLGSESSDPRSWDTYDPNTNSWVSHVDPNIVVDIEDSVVMDGKIYIRCGASAVSSHVYVVIYDPSSGTWQHADADMAAGWRGSAVVVGRTLYVLDESSGTRLMMWRNKGREWVVIGRLSPRVTRPPCRLVAVGNYIYVIGKGLSTVVFDVGNVCIDEALMVTSSIPSMSCGDLNVIRCKCLSI